MFKTEEWDLNEWNKSHSRIFCCRKQSWRKCKTCVRSEDKLAVMCHCFFPDWGGYVVVMERILYLQEKDTRVI